MEEYERANTKYKQTKDDFPSLGGSIQQEESKQKYEDPKAEAILSQN